MVFQWPGVGRMLVEAILKRDILLVQGGVVFVAACYVMFNIIVDIIVGKAIKANIPSTKLITISREIIHAIIKVIV